MYKWQFQQFKNQLTSINCLLSYFVLFYCFFQIFSWQTFYCIAIFFRRFLTLVVCNCYYSVANYTKPFKIFFLYNVTYYSVESCFNFVCRFTILKFAVSCVSFNFTFVGALRCMSCNAVEIVNVYFSFYYYIKPLYCLNTVKCSRILKFLS